MNEHELSVRSEGEGMLPHWRCDRILPQPPHKRQSGGLVPQPQLTSRHEHCDGLNPDIFTPVAKCKTDQLRLVELGLTSGSGNYIGTSSRPSHSELVLVVVDKDLHPRARKEGSRAVEHRSAQN